MQTLPTPGGPRACKICGGRRPELLDVRSFLFPDTSYAPELHVYDNYVCADCGVVFCYPEVDEARLIAYYNEAYRRSPYLIHVDGKTIDIPLHPNKMGPSFQRFETLHRMLNAASQDHPDCIPQAADTMVDFGAYQGLMLHAATQAWGCRGIAIDYNESGIAFARDFLGMTDSRTTRDICAESFSPKVRFVTLFHALEHLRDPVRFLDQVRGQVLRDDGYLYIEVPNLFGMPLADPTHFFTYTPDSLAYLLRRCGFEVISLETHGHPDIADFISRNDEQNISCLARPATAAGEPPRPAVDVAVLRRRLRASYLRHGGRGVGRQFRLALRESARFAYFFVFAAVLDRVAPGLSRTLAAKIRNRPKSPR